MDANSTSNPSPCGRQRKRTRLAQFAIGGLILGGVPLAAGSAFAAPSAGTPSPRPLAAGGLDVAAIAAKVDPAIVDINTTLPNGAAAGTGMVLTSSGEVLTNNHVIDGATDIRVQIDGQGPSHTASVLGYDAADDVALLQIDGVSGLPTVTTGDVGQLAVGDPVLALGNALGRGGTPAAASGSIVALDQTITATDDDGSNPETLNGLIQVDAADPARRLRRTARGRQRRRHRHGQRRLQQQCASRRPAVDGFAIPIDHALAIAHQIESRSPSADVHIGDPRHPRRRDPGRRRRRRAAGSASIRWSPFGGSSTGRGDAPSDGGAAVAGVESNGPADTAGLAAGDTITSLDGNGIGRGGRSGRRARHASAW